MQQASEPPSTMHSVEALLLCSYCCSRQGQQAGAKAEPCQLVVHASKHIAR
jgi:hypothetical protein